jgi:predicted Rdx family selenoprotein
VLFAFVVRFRRSLLFANYVSLWTKKEEGGIPNEEQHRQAVQATIEFLQEN